MTRANAWRWSAVAVAMAAALAACGEGAQTCSGSACTAPTVVILKPAANETLLGVVDVEGTLSDDTSQGLRLELAVDGTVVEQAYEQVDRFAFRLDTSLFSEAEHTLEIRAIDSNGNVGRASVKVSTALVILPTCPTGEWQVQYWRNATLTGAPDVAKCDSASLAYTWDASGYEPSVPNSFSMRWVAKHEFQAGEFLFSARADDGIRVWVDGVMIIDEWRIQSMVTQQARKTLTAGEHVVRVDYFEDNGGAVLHLSWAPFTGGVP